MFHISSPQVVVLLFLHALIAAADVAFVVIPITALQKSTSHRHLSPELAAKKKNTKQRRSQSPTASGKGFGQHKSPSAVAVDEGLPSSSSSSTTNVETEGVASSPSPIHADLLPWLKQNPNTFISPKFSIQPSKLGGYGGFANAPIEKDELLFRIPRECCVTYEDALTDPECGEAFRRIKEKRVPSWGMVLIAGWIAKEYLLAEEYASATESSNRIKHLPYLQSIPWNRGTLGQDHILFWSDEEVETLLGGSLAYEDALLIRKTVDSAVMMLSDFVVPIVHGVRVELRDRDLPTTDDDRDKADILERLKQAVKAAFVITLSRSFAEEVESDDGTTIEVENLLLPLIDILQHSNTPNTILEPYEDYILLRARRAVDTGEELFHQYQEENDDVIPPHKFFTRYGFVPGLSEPILEVLDRRSSLFFDYD